MEEKPKVILDINLPGLGLEQRRALFSVRVALMLDGQCSLDEVFARGRELRLPDDYIERMIRIFVGGRVRKIRTQKGS